MKVVIRTRLSMILLMYYDIDTV